MSKEVITLIAKKHNTWVDIVTTFGCPKRIAEDITQEMYIKIHFRNTQMLSNMARVFIRKLTVTRIAITQ